MNGTRNPSKSHSLLTPFSLPSHSPLTPLSTPLSTPLQSPTSRYSSNPCYPILTPPRYGDSEEKMKMYTTLMSAYGASAGITYKFGGTVANTLPAHRVIQHFQERNGPAVADSLINSLYRQYFEEEKHPGSKETLMAACKEAGIDEQDAEAVIADEDEGLMETKGRIREQAGNGVDSVPFVVVEGRRRDITLQGAQEVGDYVKALEQIVKEST